MLNMLRKVEQDMEVLRRKCKISFKAQMECLEMKNTVSQMKNTLGGLTTG